MLTSTNGRRTGWRAALAISFALAALTLQTCAIAATQVDIRTYIPASGAGSGYVSFLRVINTGNIATAVTVGLIDDAKGTVGSTGTLVASLPAGGAMTFTAAQVEVAMGLSLSAAQRPRIRITALAATTIEAQSFLLQPGGAFNEVSGAQTGSTINVRTFVPAAALSSGYVSYLRVINTGGAATPVTVAKIDPATGIVGTAQVLNASLPAGAAVTYSAAQVEAVLGAPIAASERPRIQVSGASSSLDAQSFLIQPGGAFTEVSSGQTGATVDVRTYLPASVVGYKTFLRIINTSATASPVTATMLDDSGAAGATGTIIASLPGLAAVTLSSDQIEAALGTIVAAGNRPRLRVTATSATLEVQSFLLQPGGAFNEVSNGISGTSVMVRNYIPAIDSASGYTSYLRVINTGGAATPVTIALVDAATGTIGSPHTLIASMSAGAAQTFSSAQLEAALGTTIATGIRPRIRVSATTVLEVQSFLTQPGGAFTEVSGATSSGALSSYTPGRPAQGDAYTYTQTNSLAGQAPATFLVTTYYKTVNGDGSGSLTHTIADPNYIGNSQAFDTAGHIISEGNFNGSGSVCTYSAYTGIAAPYSVGQSWNYQYVSNCTQNGVTTSYNTTNVGSFTAVETINVQAGTFTALKESYTVASTPTNNPLASSTSTDYTRWVDIVSGREVKHSQTVHTTPAEATISTVSSTATVELVSYAASGLAGSTQSPVRYAGAWSANFTGSDTGSCPALTISTAGLMTGNCTGNISGTFGLAVTLQVQGGGNLSTLATNSISFSGQINPATASGTWTNLLGGHGTWTLTHK